MINAIVRCNAGAWERRKRSNSAARTAHGVCLLLLVRMAHGANGWHPYGMKELYNDKNRGRSKRPEASSRPPQNYGCWAGQLHCQLGATVQLSPQLIHNFSRGGILVRAARACSLQC
jgi:hypothetical protein